jgi:N-glycosylase/DNA lyase
MRLREAVGAIAVTSDAKPSTKDARAIESALRRMLRLDQNLAPFYTLIADDPALSWATAGAGRLMASPTVFEDIVKTICTTNCAWSATVRMTNALAELGDGAFPTVETIATTPDSWFTEIGRMGYRGPYIKKIAQGVAAGTLDLATFTDGAALSDDDVEEALLELPGVGPYAAAHIMQLIGRHRRLVLDSWTRPTYLRLAKKKRATDTTIRRAFARYGEYAGLAFWLFLTREWISDHS